MLSTRRPGRDVLGGRLLPQERRGARTSVVVPVLPPDRLFPYPPPSDEGNCHDACEHPLLVTSYQVPMLSACWICRTQADGREDALVAPLLLHLKARNRVRGCSGRCEELRTSSEVSLARFYHLECSHYCAIHLDHRCCVCRAKESPQQRPKSVRSQ